ncbi:MAG: ATP-binding protein [Crinalium sp.]
MRKTITKTRNITNFAEAFGFLLNQDDEQMAVIYGDPGTGKSTAVQFIAAQSDAILITARPNMTGFGLVKTILSAMGATCRSFGSGLDKIIERLSESGKALFIDEADYLLHDFSLLEALRAIHDNAEVPVILVGMPGIFNKLAHHRQLCDRIHFLEFTACDLQDARLLAETRCEVRVDNDLLAAIHSFAKGNLRLIKRILSHVESHALVMGWDSCNLNRWGKQPFLPAIAQQPSFNKKARRSA